VYITNEKKAYSKRKSNKKLHKTNQNIQTETTQTSSEITQAWLGGVCSKKKHKKTKKKGGGVVAKKKKKK